MDHKPSTPNPKILGFKPNELKSSSEFTREQRQFFSARLLYDQFQLYFYDNIPITDEDLSPLWIPSCWDTRRVGRADFKGILTELSLFPDILKEDF